MLASMHPDAVAAWIRDLKMSARFHSSPSCHPLRFRKRSQPDLCKGRRPRKTRRVVLTDFATSDQSKIPAMMKPTNESNGRKRIRTPSPPKRQFPADAHSLDAESPNELDERTPRPHTRIHPVPDLSLPYINTLAAAADDVDLPLKWRVHSQSQPQSRSRSQSLSAS